MRRADLSDLTAFIAVAEQLSFRAAATKLSITPSALSQTIRQLEQRLGVGLFHRTTRSVALTDAGLRLFSRVRPAFGEIEGALEGVALQRQQPFGRLRIYGTQLSSVAVIAPVWQRFLSAFPDVHLELELGEVAIDIVARGFEAGIWPRKWAPPEMVAVRVTGLLKMSVLGAPSYFEKRRPPIVPEDLSEHDCIQLWRGGDSATSNWPFERGGEARKVAVSGRITVGSPDLMFRAAVDGLGLAYALESYAEPFLRSGQLVRVLEDWSLTSQGLFLYYPSRQRISAALRALIDMVVAERRGAERPNGEQSLP